MKTFYQRGVSVWRSLGHDAPVAFSPLLGVVMVLYAVVASCEVCGPARPVEQWLRDYGIQRVRRSHSHLAWRDSLHVPLDADGSCTLKLSFRTHLTIIGGMVLFTAFWLYGRRGSSVSGLRTALPGAVSGMAFTSSSVRCLANLYCPSASCCSFFGGPSWNSACALEGRLGRLDLCWARAHRCPCRCVLCVHVAGVPEEISLAAKQSIAELITFYSGQFFIMSLPCLLSSILVRRRSGGLRSLRRGERLGKNALFFMLMPYVLGHLGKPSRNPRGSFGRLSLGHSGVSASFLYRGAIAHWLVALVMDLSALYRRGVDFVF